MRVDDGKAVSLFPMFNILVCTLGVLIFILSSVATISLGVGKSITVVPGVPETANHSKSPTYVEWTGTELVLLPSKETVRFERELSDIRTYEETYTHIDKVLTGSRVENLFNEIRANHDTEYIIVLLRPSGFHNFAEIRGYTG